MQKTGAHDQALVLADRAAAHIALDNLAEVVRLLRELRKVPAGAPIQILATRVGVHMALGESWDG